MAGRICRGWQWTSWSAGVMAGLGGGACGKVLPALSEDEACGWFQCRRLLYHLPFHLQTWQLALRTLSLWEFGSDSVATVSHLLLVVLADDSEYCFLPSHCVPTNTCNFRRFRFQVTLRCRFTLSRLFARL